VSRQTLLGMTIPRAWVMVSLIRYEKFNSRNPRALISVWLAALALVIVTTTAASAQDLRAAPPTQPGSAAPLAEQMELKPPDLRALISVTARLHPFQLDAQSTEVISLKEVLQRALAHNLDIRIRQLDVKSKKWNLLSSYGQFLPNTNLSYQWQYLKGTLNVPIGGVDHIRLNSPFIITSAGYEYYAFRGGQILFTALQNRNYLRAARHQEHATLSDVLYEATKRYYDLVFSEAQLQIRIQAVRTSEDQLELNQNLLDGGMATMLDVLQARTQLASDRQALIDQQIARRNAAINLADYLDQDQSVDLVPAARILQRIRLLSENVTPGLLIGTAIEHRPELKQYEQLRLAAKKGIAIAAAPLMPTFRTYGTVFGIGETLSDQTRLSLNPITLPGTFINQRVVPHLVSRQIQAVYTIGYQVQWKLTGLGTSDLADIKSAKYQARQAQLESNKELNTITNQVRQAYLNSLSTNRKIEETTTKVDSSAEELRLAQLRFQHGVGKNIDILRAQEDYTSALIENAQALVSFNVAQAKLLHDLGIISIGNLTADRPVPLAE